MKTMTKMLPFIVALLRGVSTLHWGDEDGLVVNDPIMRAEARGVLGVGD